MKRSASALENVSAVSRGHVRKIQCVRHVRQIAAESESAAPLRTSAA
ncbi:MAG: hypothetical protein BWZ07_00207 [Alphaproteobacteria bacterium ADurb.BinA280]|jgi:hypothetical protein|nr:MAG: hypothetical protein BWZ07_00207 [Alphaproteobacteria bacterium ADurb.BinA280]